MRRSTDVRRAGVLVVAACVAGYGLVTATSPAAWADHGGGSVRSAGRGGPPERVVVEAHDPHGEPARDRPEVHVDVRPAPVRVEAPARRDWDDRDEDVRHGGGFARGVPAHALRGARVHDLPHHVILTFNNLRYFFDDDGNYYEQQGADYVVVQPPVGVTVTALPPGVETVVAGPTTFYYVDGVFYVPQGGVFAVVNPPAGIVVPDLPAGAGQVVVNGNVCYQFNGLNYQPSVQGGVTVYTVTPL